MVNRIKVTKLEKIQPILKVENEVIISKHGDITIPFRLLLPEIYSLGPESLEHLHVELVKAFNILPAGTTVHKQDWFVQDSYNKKIDSDINFFDKASERHFFERPFLNHRCNLYITRKVDEKRRVTSVTSSLNRSKFIPKECTDSRLIQEFLDAVEQMESILNDSGYIKLKRLKNAEIVGTREEAGVIEAYMSLILDGQIPTLKDIDFTQGLKIGNYYCNLFTLSDVQNLPQKCGPKMKVARYNNEKSEGEKTIYSSFGTNLGLFCNTNHVYNQYFIIEEREKVLNSLQIRKNRMESFSKYSRQNSIYSEHIDYFINEATNEQRKIVKAHFNIMLFEDDIVRLKESNSKVSSSLAKIDAIPKEESYSIGPIWWAGIPGNASELPEDETFTTFLEQSTCFLNLETNYKNSLSPIGIKFTDRLSGRPIHVDLSDEPWEKGIINNRNKFILGPSGSGKSFVMNHLVRSYYKQNSHIVIIDVGHSYQGLCSYLGGVYYTYTEDKPIQFNPFLLGEGDTLDIEKKESIKSLLLTLWKAEDETNGRSEYVTISLLITKYFDYLNDNKDVRPCFNTFYEYLRDVFVSFLEKSNVREKDFDVKNFIHCLSPYYRGGEFDYLLNSPQNIDLLNEQLIVFELDNIKDHEILFPVVTIIIMDVFISKLRKLQGIRKQIIIEEAWKAIAKAGMATFIKYLYRTVRKHFGEAILVTQDLADILTSPILGETVVTNSDCKILLDQKNNKNKGDLKNALGLSDKEEAQVLSVNTSLEPSRKYKEIFVSLAGQYSNVYGVEVSLEEYLLYTTEQKEKKRVAEYAKKYKSYQKGIQALANEIRLAG